PASGLREGASWWRSDGNLVQAHRVLEDELVERRLAERRFRRRVPLRLGVRPGAIEPREVARPHEVLQTHLGDAAEPTLLLDLEGEVDLALHELTRPVRQRDVGREDAARRSAEIVLAVEAPEQERHPADAGLLENEAHPGMPLADPRKDHRAHQLR